MVRNPEPTGTHSRDADHRWHRHDIQCIDAPDEAFLYYEQPPKNQDIYSRNNDFEFEGESRKRGWEVYDSRILSENWLSALGEKHAKDFSYQATLWIPGFPSVQETNRASSSSGSAVALSVRRTHLHRNSPQYAWDQPDAIFRTHRVIPFIPWQIFEAFDRLEYLARWWGPDGFTNTFEVFESIRPGSRWKFVMHGPDGSNHPHECVVLKMDYLHTIVIKQVSAPRFVLTVTLAKHEGGTRIDWVMVFEDSAVAAALRHIVEPANEQNLDRLESLLWEATQ
jgi:uncharacterized protein YndB with AHSA1/START domain